MNSFIYTGSELTVVVDNVPYTIDRSYVRFNEVLEAVKEGRWSDIPNLISVAKAVTTFGEGKIEVDEDEGVIRYNGTVLNNALSNRIMWMMNDGFNVDPFIKFVENLMSNPSKRAIDELYTFLEYGKLPITEDGCFLAYKRVRGDYKDVYSNTVLNKPYDQMTIGEVDSLPYTTKQGVTVECGDDGETTISMPRNKVDDRSEVTCSDGLHFCSLEYLKSFSGERVVILKINPRDVVSIPVDYNNTKGRCSSYVVAGEYEGAMTSPAFTKSVYSSDGSDYDPEDQDEDLEEDFHEIRGGDAGTFDVSQEYIEAYVKGHKAGRKRLFPEIEVQNLADGEPYEGSDYSRGYVDGYKDGKSHKARQYTL